MGTFTTSASRDEAKFLTKALEEYRAQVKSEEEARRYTTVYEATYNSDTIEGRGYTVRAGYFTTEAEALKARDYLPGVFGSPNTDRVEVRKVYETFEGWRHDWEKRK